MSRQLFTTIILILILVPVFAIAQNSTIVNYQGLLTDSDGTPVIDGFYDIEILLFPDSMGSDPLWSDSYFDVHVTLGLLNVQFEPDMAAVSQSSFIEIRVEGETLTPRHRITQAPFSAITQRVNGDIRTAPGVIEITPPEPCVPPDDCNPAVTIAATNDINEITINKPPDNNIPAIKLKANNENMIDLFYPGGGSNKGIVQIGANEAIGGFIELHAADSITLTRVMMGGSITDTGYVRLFGGGSLSEYKLLELSSHTNTGGNLSIFDPYNIDGREMLRVGNMFEVTDVADGIGIFGFNPQPEPPGHVAFELTSEESQGGRLAVYNTDDASAVLTGDLMHLGRENVTVDIGTDASQAGIVIQNMPAADEGSSIGIESNLSNAGIVIQNMPADPTSDIGIAEITAEESHVNMSLQKGNSLVELQANNSPSFSMVNNPSAGVTSQIQMQADDSQSQVLVSSESSAGITVPIVMTASQSLASVGIGTDTPVEALTVMGNGWFSGEVFMYTVTDAKRNIVPIDGALDKVNSMNGYYYNCRTDEYPNLNMREGRSIGFLAEEVKEIVPEAVGENERGLTGVSYNKITALLVEAVKELKAENEELRARIENLEKN